MANADQPVTLAVELVWSPVARDVRVVHLRLPAGSVLADAIRAAGLPEPLAWLAGQASANESARPALAAGVWGRRQPLDHPLRDGDRVEVWRALKVDPKEARRLRYRRSGGAKSLKERRKAAMAAQAGRKNDERTT